MMQTHPYFMNDKSWYTYDKATDTYALTDKAPKKAVESFEKFMQERKQPYDWFAGMSDKEFGDFVDAEIARLKQDKN